MQSENVSIETPDENALLAGANALLSGAQAYVIDSAPVYEAAAVELAAIKKKAKELDDERKSLTKPLDEVKGRIMNLFRRPLEVLANAEAVLKRGMLGFQQEQGRRQAAADAEARRIAAAETERLQREQEREAKKLEKKGDVEGAAAVRSVPPPPVPIVAATIEAPKIRGVSTREVWKARVVNATLVPREYLVVNEKMLADVAKATKGQLVIAGVEFYSEQVLASGRAS